MGTSRNPRDPERITGGSSGGSAAALAAGLVPLALGSDTGGSIRLPAAYCEVVGLKPTWGRVSLEGVWPLAPSLDHAGPMATTTDDAGLLYEVLTGTRLVTEPGEIRVGVSPELGLPAAPPPGAREVAFPEAELIVLTFRAIQLAESLQTHRRAGLYPSRRAEYGDDVGHRLDAATAVGLDEYLDATVDRGRLRAAFDRVFDQVDVLLTPIAAIPPPRFDDLTGLAALRQAVIPYTGPQDLVGLPSCAIPSGIQVTGPPGAESRVLAAAAMLA